MTPKRLQILQPLTSKQWPLSTVAYRHFASSSDIKTNHKPQPPKPSLYQLLFPKDPTPKPSKASHSTTSTSNTSNDDLEPPRISLQDDQELSEWMKQLHSHTSSKTDTGHKEADIPTVLILSAPRDLLESDFYRVAPQGQHVQGWTSGPDKVIQSRSQTTLTPQELYYLFFPSRPSATYYLSILKHQHSLARTTLLSLLSSPPSLSPSPQSLPYSLIPPHYPKITSALHPLPTFLTSYYSHTLPKSRQQTSKPFPLFQPLFPHLSSLSSPTPTTTPTPPTTTTPESFPQQNFILLRLHNGKIPIKLLGNFILSDVQTSRGGHRWGLLNRDQQKKYNVGQLTPLRSTMSYVKLPESYQQQRQQEEDEDGGEEQEQGGKTKGGHGQVGKKGEIQVYSRFIIGFEHPAEAKRFARCWHKKELVDEVRGQVVVCNTAVLW